MSFPVGGNYAYSGDAANGWFNAADQRIALMQKTSDRIVAGEQISPSEISAIATQDKKLSLQAEQDKTMYEVANAQWEANQTLRKKNKDAKQRLLDAGAIFA